MLHGITLVLFLPLLVWKTRNSHELKERKSMAIAIIPIFALKKKKQTQKNQDAFLSFLQFCSFAFWICTTISCVKKKYFFLFFLAASRLNGDFFSISEIQVIINFLKF